MGQTKDRGIITGVKVVLILPIIFICIAFLLNLLYSLPIKDSLLWYVGVFLCFYIPGSLLLRYLDFNKDEYFIKIFHSIALGAALMPLVYMVLRKISHPEIIFILGIAMFLVWGIFTVKDLKENRSTIYTSYPDMLSVLVLTSMVLVLLHLSYFTDVVFLEKGFKIRNTSLSETEFHLGIINNLKDSFPPFFPYTSGASFSHYHINMHLEIEMFNRLFSTDTLKLTYFYFPLLYFCLLVYVPYIFVCKYWNMRFLGVLTGVLIFCSDLSFVPGLLGNFPPDMPWTVIFAPVLWPLFTLNGFLPALFVMFLCLFYLKKFYDEENLLYLLVFGILGFSSYGFKSSMGLHIMGAAFLAGIVSTIFIKDRTKCKLICVVSALTVLAMVIDLTLLRGGIGNNIFKIEAFNRFYETLKHLWISNLSWPLYLIIFPAYILATFGIRALGFYLFKAIFEKKYIDPTIIFLMIFVISGFLLSEFVFLGSPFSALLNINNAMWFSFQSLTACWFLLLYFLLMIDLYKNRYRSLIFILVFLLSMPSTVQFLSVRSKHGYDTVSYNATEVVKYFETVPRGSVILHPLNPKEPSLSSNFAGKLDVLNFYKSCFDIGGLRETELVNRMNDVKLFFNPNAKIDRASILKKYNVDYVYAPMSYTPYLDKEPMLLQVLKNSEYVLYRVDRANKSL